MSLLALFKWLGHTSVGHYLQRSQWAFAVIATLHLLALATLGGSLLAVSLRSLGVLRFLSPRQLARELFPVALASLMAIVITGVLMVSEEALKCYYSPAFRAKMVALAFAIAVSVPVYLLQARQVEDRSPWWLRIGSALALLAWLSVGVAGRAIGIQ